MVLNTLILMKSVRRFIQILFFLLVCSSLYLPAQQSFYLGVANANDDFIYEDAMLDDGTRMIISDMYGQSLYNLALCMFIPEEGDPFYGIAVESKQYIPDNGLLVFQREGVEPLVLYQVQTASATRTKLESGPSPSLLFLGGSVSMFFTRRYSVKTDDFYFAIYGITLDEISELLEDSHEARISSRSKYNNIIHGYTKDRFKKWLSEALTNIEIRAMKSLNTILD